MSARIKIDELPVFDAAPYLDSDEAIAAYLTDILQANDAGLLAAALGDIARARGMTDIAKAAGITREALYKALRPGRAALRPSPESRRPGLCHPGRHSVATLLLMHPLIEAHRDELLALARRRGLTGVRVFGSMSRGDGGDDSDVDLLVTLAPGSSALALGGLLMDAQELLGRNVDVVTESSLHPELRDRVVASAVPL